MQAVSSSSYSKQKELKFAYDYDQGFSKLISIVQAPVVDFDKTTRPLANTYIDPVLHNAEFLEDQKMRLEFDIEKLRKHNEQLKIQKRDLKKLIVQQNLGEVGRLQAQVLYSQTKAEELGQMRQDAIDNAHKIEELKDVTHNDIIDSLKHEIKLLKMEVTNLTTKLQSNDKKLKFINDKREEMIYSELYDTIEHQKRKIQKLKVKLKSEVSRHQDLKDELRSIGPIQSLSLNVIIELKKKLKYATKRYKRAKEEYIMERSAQINDIKVAEELMIRVKEEKELNQNNTTITITNLPPTISTQLLRMLFETCGVIESISISSEVNSKEVSAEISYQTHEQAVAAMKTFDGKDLDDNHKIHIEWYQKKVK
ncbi:hypothetical protein TVAG_007240 [Trichomonas vaginalis G3]|uniref:RRM domain-containing protein n=1 Tax=Trichomonas vaginalis (strain ATCC PRA-98 / G3) TaxID=412133 RepID=A2F4I5_TRIV3|nr:RNA-binding domain, RBD family-containing protein [Trichomonas vaginalis G3]EAY00194.1 hypothetical protein TVAG_007240 [Trichomonas vaginalis G3]KAI5536146.1 RNA-binding domain, RBD family-containing protein [Trichomonas vaginalis G3]|eukprot:XP_001313123.1 hypothetical protein [Trichomonas vaginalis G3]